ncbi:hypothetical protein ACFLQ3_00920 [Bacteroidota bacterium]
MKPSHKIVFNTGVLYVKLLVVMALSLFTTRLVLGALGETNYGIYSLVAGVVGMLAIMQSAMSSASMRFMAHSLGSNNEILILKTFNTTLFLHIIIGLVVVAIIEIGGYFMFDYLLNIPADKVFDAKVVFHFMALTTFVSIIAVPYDAVINSHENLLALSIVDVIGSFLKLGLAIYLTVSHFNLLILYGFGMLAIQIIMRIIKQRYSVTHYKECTLNLKIYIDKSLAREILYFSGWNLFGSIAGVSVTQVRSVLLNMFFGVTINAADGISKTSSGQVNLVSTSLTRAINPQLVKSEGSGDRQKMLRITNISTKFSVFLFALFAIPVILETPYLLNVWLKNVPAYAVIFVRLTLIGLFIDKFTFEITSAIRAVGNIRNLTIVEAVIAFTNIPVAYLFFKMGFPPYSIYIISIIIGSLAILNRFYFGKKVAGMNIYIFIKNGISPIFILIILATLFSLIPLSFLHESFIRLILVSLTFILTLTISFWFFGLTNEEHTKMKQILHSILKKAKRLK